jgi:fructokinase
MIAVAGEALIDLVVTHDGHIAAQPGGGPFNTARTVGRLGHPAMFLGRLSQDGFGRMLRDLLNSDGVSIGVPEPTNAPTTLAAVDVDPAGLPRYGFYLDGTSSAVLDYEVLSASLPTGLTALHTGTLALAMEPSASAIERLITTDVPPDVLVMVDPNCRPQAIADREAYLARMSCILGRTDVVKVSVEDLEYLFPDSAPDVAVGAILAQGPTLVLLTDGPRPAQAFLPDQVVAVDVPDAPVVDTIGAGDAFGGAFLTWWCGNGLTRSDLNRVDPIREALLASVEVAALTCTRVGAEPPWLAEVEGRPGWLGSSTLPHEFQDQ